jgi:hypothetical protein
MRRITGVAVALAAAILPIVGLSAGQAVAKPKPKAAPQILVTCSPNPVVETATSNVDVVCQVEANPTFAGKAVTISSTQFASHCVGSVEFETFVTSSFASFITLTLDNDGNATLLVIGTNCAPGSAIVTADVDSPPFSTAITKLIITPPQVTPPGVKGFPANEVEVGDGGPAAPGAGNNAASEVDAIFYIETNPVFAEQTATLTSDQLVERCGGGFFYLASFDTVLAFGAPRTGVVVSGTIDNDGNLVFEFQGSSCAAGKSTVIADVQSNGPTYSTQFDIMPPAVTI